MISKIEKLFADAEKFAITVDYNDYENLYACCSLGYGIDDIKTNKRKDGLVHMEKSSN